MASKSNVERLFELPYFQQMLEKVGRPMADQLVQLISADDEDEVNPQLLEKAIKQAYTRIFNGMFEITADLYAEVLTDEEVGHLREICQHPTILKLQDIGPKMIPRLQDWMEKNGAAISLSIRATLNEAD